MLERALELLRAGLSILPVRAGGSKAPAIPTFDKYKTERRATEQEVREWFSDGVDKGIGVLCGRMSDNLVVLDFETKDVYDAWAHLVEYEIDDFDRLPVVDSPKGVHVYVCLPEPTPGKKLAMKVVNGFDKDSGESQEKRETLIEFRGDGHYVVGAGTPGYCHDSGVGWTLRSGDDIVDAPNISMEQWHLMVRFAKSFNEAPLDENVISGVAKISKDDERPGSDYCRRSTVLEWRALLELHGWTCIREDGSRQIWKRPGKESPGGSATLGFCTTELGLVLYVFSTNAHPFQEDRAYSIFAARAHLEFSGEFRECAQALQREGYGKPASEEVRAVVAEQIKQLKFLRDKGSLDCPDVINQLTLASRKFRDLWERKRKDLGDDIGRYEICLLTFCYGKLGTPEESGIVRGLRLVALWREKYDEDPDKIFDLEYAAKKVEWVMSRSDKDEDDVLKSHEAEKAGNTKDARFAWLSGRLGFDIVRFVQVGPNVKEGSFYFVTPEDRWVRVGNLEELRDVKRCEMAIQADVDEDGNGVPGFRGAFREEVRVKVAWDGLVAILFDNDSERRMREVEEADGRRKRILSWLEQYSDAKGAYDQTAEDQVSHAIMGGRPYLEDGQLCFQIDSFNQFLKTQRDQRFSDIVMRDLLRDAGVSRFKKVLRVEGKQIQRRYWRIAVESLPSSTNGAVAI